MHLAHAGAQRAQDGIDGQALAENTRRRFGAQGIGEIRNRGAIRQQVELQQGGIGGQGALRGSRGLRNQGGDELLGALHGIGGKRKFDLAGFERAEHGGRGPEEFRGDARVGGRRNGRLDDGAAGLLRGCIGTPQPQDAANQRWNGQHSNGHEQRQRRQRQFSTRGTSSVPLPKRRLRRVTTTGNPRQREPRRRPEAGPSARVSARRERRRWRLRWQSRERRWCATGGREL